MEDYDNDPVLQKYQFPTQQNSSDAKRLAAINDKIEKEKASKQLIKSALSGQVLNKKIVFAKPTLRKVEEPKEEPKSKPKFKSKPEPEPKSKKLFDDQEDENESFKLDISSKRMKSSKESKIIELQSRFAHDPRFKIDDKFIDDEDGGKGEAYGDDGEEDGLNRETEKELDILEEVLGKPLKRKFKQQDDKPTSSIIIPRYDPTKPEFQKFKIRKVDKLEPYQLPEDEKDEAGEKPETSKERFYEISETFTKDFQDDQTDGQSFSLTAMFGRPTADIPETSVEIGAVKPKRHQSKDKVDSKKSIPRGKSSKKQETDSEEDEEDEEDEDEDDDDEEENASESSEEEQSSKKKKSKSNDEKSSKKSKSSKPEASKTPVRASPKINKSKVSNPLLKYERFFFTENDERFSNNNFFDASRIKAHIASWSDKKTAMTTALTKKRRHFKHVGKLKTALESKETGDKDLKRKYRIYKETTKKH